MKYTTLPKTSIKVSKICLGTMTWGNQNTQDEAFDQMDYALEQGVNFLILQNCTLCQQLQKPMQTQNASLETGFKKQETELKLF